MPLAPYAAHPDQSRGRVYAETPSLFRSPFERDRDRIIHSAAFRRLEYKTQVFVNHEGDLFRTRLTHTLEVAQVARSIARILQLNEDLTEAIALAHDLGHTPFGHAGQDVLNICMRPWGGFEHNYQSLRIIDELEQKYPDFNGLNLTFETREGILKHCTQTRAKNLGDLGKRFIDGGQPSLEAQLANIADQIAYNHHDIDDGLRAGILTWEMLLELPLVLQFHAEVTQQFPDLDPKRLRHEILRRMLNFCVQDLITHSRQQLRQVSPENIDFVRAQTKPLIILSPEIFQAMRGFKHFLHQNLYKNYRVNRMTFKAEKVVRELFEVFMAHPNLLPNTVKISANSDTHQQARAICDYLAGMTDRYALAEYERIFAPHALG